MNNMNMADIMAFIEDDCYELQEKAEKIFSYITDLEAKLAESEKEHELLIDDFEKETENLRKQIKRESDARKRFVEEVKQLKQQLEEWQDGTIICKWTDAENKVKELEQQLTVKDKEIKELRFLKRNIFPLVENLEEKVSQDKIDYAVEQFEQLKTRIKVRQEDWNTGVDYEFTGLLPDYDIYEEIDNQIKALNEQENEQIKN